MICKSTVLSLPPLKLKATPVTLQKVRHCLPVSVMQGATQENISGHLPDYGMTAVLTHTGQPYD